jgi:NAD+ dependent glucose-6-phosphate dehydrogenase
VTGAEGLIGSAVRAHLAERYELVALTRERARFPSHVADITDLDALLPAFEGADAVVHLAAVVSTDSPWEEVLPANIIGTRNVFEAARRSGVGAVVLASSNHAVGMYELEAAPALYALDDPRVVDETAELRPDSLYGVSKAFGETLGRYYSDAYGMRVVCLRIGTVRADDDPCADPNRERVRATWLSQRDCTRLVAASLDAEDVSFAIVYGISDNPRQFWSLARARELGYEPLDAAPLDLSDDTS